MSGERLFRATVWTLSLAGCAFTDAASAATLGMPLLMPDDFSELGLVAWRVEPGTPDPDNPLVEGEMPWDRGGVGIHGSVFRDPIDRLWKAYVVCTPAEEFPEKTPENQGQPWASENHAQRRVCLFESTDGVDWTRPELANVPFGDHKTTNIIFDVSEGVSAYSSVIVDPAKRDWPYEMFVLRESWSAVRGKPSEGNGYYRYRSRDGRSWHRMGGKVAGPMTGDLSFFYRDPPLAPPALPGGEGDAGGYVAYYRLGDPQRETDHLPLYEDVARRSCFRAVSRDGNQWVKDPVMFLTADQRDHRDTQYQECVPLRVPRGYIAMITMYHPITQTLNLRLAASRDGRQWWFPDRRPCLDNAPLGDYGGGMIWQSQYLIVEGDKLYVYYGGTEGPHRQISDTRAPSKQVGYQETIIDHGAHFLPFNSALCRARWRFDRLYALVSSAGGPTVGIAVTKPQPLGGKKLYVNLRTRPAKKPTPVGQASHLPVDRRAGSKSARQSGLEAGYLQVELLDAQGHPLPGFARGDCVPLEGDRASVEVTWKAGTAAPAAARQAKFYLKRAFLYGFEFRPAAGPAESPPPSGESLSTASAGTVSPMGRASVARGEKRNIEMRAYEWKGPYTEMRMNYATPHDPGLCVDVRAPWMADGERLILRACEIIGYDAGYLYDDHFPPQEQDGRGRGYQHIRLKFDTGELPQALAADGVVPGKGRFRIQLTAKEDFVDIALAVRNDLVRPMEYIDWYFCVVGYESPTIGDATLERTFVFDGRRLRTLAEMSGRGQGEEMYPIAGPRGSSGFIPPLHRSYPRGPVEAQAPIVLVEDVFGTHTVALGFERAHSIFSSTGNRCFHADPFFGLNAKSGEERKTRGRLYLMQGTARDAFKRFQREFAESGSGEQ